MYSLANVTLESFETEHCVWLEVASIFLSLVFEKILQMAKKLVKMIGCTYVCYHICRRNLLIFSWAKHLEPLPVDFRLLNCVLR